jgi:Domain of unknown function (DUF1877)
MGMIGKFVALPPETFASLRNDPAALDAYLYSEDGDDPDQVHPECDFLEVSKLWHGMHFLLTGAAGGAEPPLGLAVLGGEECGNDTGYGPPRCLDAAQVRTVAAALDRFSVEGAVAKYSPADLDAAKVYSPNWRKNPERMQEAADWLGCLADFYREAAEQGKVVIKYID